MKKIIILISLYNDWKSAFKLLEISKQDNLQYVGGNSSIEDSHDPIIVIKKSTIKFQISSLIDRVIPVPMIPS